MNAILNGMIRDGQITSFETNFDDLASIAFGLHVRVLADLGVAPRTRAFDERRRELRDRILGQLQPLAEGIIISVRGAKAASSNDTKGVLADKLANCWVGPAPDTR